MASIIEGYEYDIFISYRQKDNKHDGWVTEFVNQLKGELESTFKEEINVYFDINPHDSLLETHDVDASIKEKLKCLVFIPIISRTYCDPKSFAWVHEFKAFIEQASGDQFGLKVKLPGGNVANRVLPVQIHDLDQEDKKLIENELGGFIRGIEFIYKEPGVNKPLKPDDDDKINFNKTRYRNQVNKVANAIKEILTGLKNPDHSGKETTEKITDERPSWRIARNKKKFTGSLLILALIMAGYFLVSKLVKPAEQLEKSIAVLPFINDSPDKDNSHIINGIMEEILINLQKIRDLRVISRNSIEQYRGENKSTTPDIAKKLGVNYIVEGSGQKFGNTIRLRVQLIIVSGGKEKHLWGESYEKEINDTKDYFIIQSQIAEAIAERLEAVITPEEKQLIEKAQVTNMLTYDLYRRGKEEYWKYRLDFNRSHLKTAEYYFRHSLESDSTFAPSYTGLVRLIMEKLYSQPDLLESSRDSIETMINIALTYDDRIPEAYELLGNLYAMDGMTDKALDAYNKALIINPNYWEVYFGLAELYSNDDMLKLIENVQKAVTLNPGPERPALLRRLANAYARSGFMDKAVKYITEVLSISLDSSAYFSFLANNEYILGNYNEAAEYCKKAFLCEPNNSELLYTIAIDYSISGKYAEGFKYLKQYIETSENSLITKFNETHRIGMLYYNNGFINEANFYFDKQLDYCNSLIKSGGLWAQKYFTYYDLAGVYAFRGDKGKAYYNLKIFNRKERFPLWMPNLIKIDPLFESIRNEPEFQQIIRDVEAKYQAEHERVRKWLEEQGML